MINRPRSEGHGSSRRFLSVAPTPLAPSTASSLPSARMPRLTFGTCKVLLAVAGAVGVAAAAPVLLAPLSLYAQPSPSLSKQSATSDDIATVLEEFDIQIRQAGSAEKLSAAAAQGSLDQQTERLILQRELLRRAGGNQLWEYAYQSREASDFVFWLMGDLDALRYYITGGTVWANAKNGPAPADYIKSLDTFRRIREANAADLEREDADVHLRMMIAASMDVSNRVRLWTGDPGFVSDPLVRYQTIKTFRDDPRYRFKKELFDALPVESMRYVFENQITDEELPWLANYSLSRFPAADAASEESRLNAYSYVWYTGDFTKDKGYSNPAFYDQAKFTGPVTEFKPTDGSGKPPRTWKGGWSEKYKLAYEDPNFPNASPDDPFHIGCGETSSQPGATQDKTAYHRLWMVFEKGGVCGALAKTYANLNGMAGVPSFVIGQPGHAATLTYELRKDASGKMVPTYRIQNDVSGWGGSKSPSVAHWLCGWGRATSDEFAAPYTLYAQSALSDWSAYVRSYEARMLAGSFADAGEKERAIDAALVAQPKNYDAITAKADLMQQRGASADEWVELARGIATSLAFDPLPMSDLIKQLNTKSGGKHLIALEEVRIGALNRAAQATADDTVNHDACKRTASRLLGQKDGKVVDFSFDGDAAGTIRLGEHLQGGGVPWRYSLDGGKTWTEVTDGSYQVALSDAQIARINADDDIQVQFIGLASCNIIDIKPAPAAPLPFFKNDRANALYFDDASSVKKMEFREGDGAWKRLEGANEFAGTRSIEVRTAATGTSLASQPATVEFSADQEPSLRFIPYSELKVNSVSSAQGGAQTATRVLDGNVSGKAYWHNTWAGEANPWIVIDLGRERDIAAIDFWARPDRGNGTPGTLEILVARDGAQTGGEGMTVSGDPVVADSAFTVVKRFEKIGGWKGGEPKRFELDAPQRARYVKLRVPNGNKAFFSCSLLDVFEADAPAAN